MPADFAREKGVLFDRWCSACKAEDSAYMREIMLLEKFKNRLPERIVVYLNEQKVTTLQQTTSAAEFLSFFKSCLQSAILHSIIFPRFLMLLRNPVTHWSHALLHPS